jgi:hypothetical protein
MDIVYIERFTGDDTRVKLKSSGCKHVRAFRLA